MLQGKNSTGSKKPLFREEKTNQEEKNQKQTKTIKKRRKHQFNYTAKIKKNVCLKKEDHTAPSSQQMTATIT